ncbi:MAG: YolD-like family protein [Bacillota bacterium]
MNTPYDDILPLPHHVSEKHPPMSRLDRAAQFSPFAALTGYEAAVEETARLTDRRIELDEGEKEAIDQQLTLVQERLPEPTEVTITYFMPDKKKAGGAYVSVSGTVKKIDDYERTVILREGTSIPIDDILHINGELFDGIGAG